MDLVWDVYRLEDFKFSLELMFGVWCLVFGVCLGVWCLVLSGEW